MSAAARFADSRSWPRALTNCAARLYFLRAPGSEPLAFVSALASSASAAFNATVQPAASRASTAFLSLATFSSP
eukprot:2075952-Alexandrium_andersonii.AAC.1